LDDIVNRELCNNRAVASLVGVEIVIVGAGFALPCATCKYGIPCAYADISFKQGGIVHQQFNLVDAVATIHGVERIIIGAGLAYGLSADLYAFTIADACKAVVKIIRADLKQNAVAVGAACIGHLHPKGSGCIGFKSLI